MKQTRRLKKLLLAVLSVTAFSLATLGFTVVGANEIKNPMVNDYFNDFAYNDTINMDKWEKFGDDENTIKQVGSGKSPSLKMTSSTEQCPCYTTSKYTIKSIQFDMQMCGGAWRGVDFKSDISASKTVYSSPFLFVNNYITTLSGAGVYPHEDNTNQWYTYKFETNETYDKVNVYYALTGEELVKVVTDYEINLSVWQDAYVLMGSADPTHETYFDNVIIEAPDGNKTIETFDEGVEYFNTEGSSYTSIYSDGRLEFNGTPKDSRIIAKNPVILDESIVESLISADISFNVKLTGDSKIALLIAADRMSDYMAEGSYYFEFASTGATLYKITDSGKTQVGEAVALSNLASGSDINVIINKNGTVTFKEGGAVKGSFTIDKYAGYYGFSALGDGTNASLCNVAMNSVNYFVPTTKSLTNNFSTDYIGGETTRDYYITSDPANTLYIENGKLVFNGCSDRTVFAPCYEYDNFILDYKMTDIYVGVDGMENTERTGVDHWFGLDISREHFDTAYYGTYLMLYFRITPLQDEIALSAYTTSGVMLPEDLNITEIKKIPKSLFTDIHYDGETKTVDDVKSGDAVCVRWVSENNVLKLYMKKASETEFVHYYTVSGIEIRGYLSLCCTGFTYLRLDDFSIANTSNVYNCASNEAPETVVKEVTPKYDYNKYIASGTLQEEINLIENASGCSSSVQADSMIIIGAVLLVFVIFTIVRGKKNNEKGNE